MKLFTPQIVWHGNKDPIYGLDFHRRREDCILATGGADSEVRVREPKPYYYLNFGVVHHVL